MNLARRPQIIIRKQKAPDFSDASWPAIYRFGEVWPAIRSLGEVWPAIRSLGEVWWSTSKKVHPSIVEEVHRWHDLIWDEYVTSED